MVCGGRGGEPALGQSRGECVDEGDSLFVDVADGVIEGPEQRGAEPDDEGTLGLADGAS